MLVDTIGQTSQTIQEKMLQVPVGTAGQTGKKYPPGMKDAQASATPFTKFQCDV